MLLLISSVFFLNIILYKKHTCNIATLFLPAIIHPQHTHIMACHCVLGNFPHTLALGSSVPGLWSAMSTITWFAAFCPRRHISL